MALEPPSSEDLDAYPATDAPPPATPSTVKSLISEGSDPGTDTDRVLALAQFYVELGQRLSGHGVAEILQTLTSVGRSQVAGAEDAGITRFHGGTVETIGATSELVSSTDKLQYTLLSGPCIDAVLADGMFHTGQLRSEARWPQFGPQAFEATGVQSMLSYRLFVEEDGGWLGRELAR